VKIKRSIYAIIILLISSLSFGESNHKELLKKVDELVTFPSNDFSAEYTIVQDSPGEGRSVSVVAMFRRDREGKYLILIMSPETERGKGYLKIGDSLWLYDPENRVFKFTSSKERFRNSNARNSDFTSSNFYNDYEVIGAKKEMLGKLDCLVLDLRATSEEISFQRMKIWISDDNLVRKTEDYSLSGQLLRTTAIPSYQKVGSKFVPVSVVIVDALRGKMIDGKLVNERTQISIARPSLKDLPDSVFTKAQLEKSGR
jgi:outer membrane lipoprotein-sorting protein